MLAGRIVIAFRRVWNSNRIDLYRLLGAAGIVLMVPPVIQYWLSRVQVPPVPISAIVAMAVASFFLLSFASVVWVCLNFARQMIQVTASRAGYTPPVHRTDIAEQTGGSFSATSDSRLWATEQFEDLKRQGVLNDTDVRDVEDFMKEISKRAANGARSR